MNRNFFVELGPLREGPVTVALAKAPAHRLTARLNLAGRVTMRTLLLLLALASLAVAGVVTAILRD